MKFTIASALLGVGLVQAGGEDWKAPGPDDCTFLCKTSAALTGGAGTELTASTSPRALPHAEHPCKPRLPPPRWA